MSNIEQELERNRILVTQFVEGATALIVDPNTGSRTRLVGTLVNIGVKRHLIDAVGTYEEAETVLKKKTVRIIVSEYMIGPRSGLELFQFRRAQDPNPRMSLLALVTGNSSQSAVAQAAEEDVDTFVLKPYTPLALKSALVAAVSLKMNPTPYLKMIETGKDELEGGKLEQALQTFSNATKLEKEATLAHFYKGQVEIVRQALAEAAGSFGRGLQLNGIHYKCLLGLYTLLRQQKRDAEAYEVVRKLAKFFPANPKRMAEVLTLAVSTANYPDIEEYYGIFKELEQRPNELVNYVCSGMVVTGKYYLMSDRVEEALKVFENVGVTGAGATKFLRYIIETLVKYGLHAEAPKFLKRFRGDAIEKVDFAAAEYLVASCEESLENLIFKGRKLIQQELHDPLIYEIYVSSLSANESLEEAQDWARKASLKFPQLRDRMDEILGHQVERGDDLAARIEI